MALSNETKRLLTEDEQQDFAWDDVEEHWVLVEEKITDQRRWDTCYTKVYRDTRDDTYWRFSFSRGSTEMQESQRDYDDHLTRVYPHKVEKVEYRKTPQAERKPDLKPAVAILHKEADRRNAEGDFDMWAVYAVSADLLAALEDANG